MIKSGYNEEVQIIDLEKIMIKNTMSTLAEFSNKVKEVTSAQKNKDPEYEFIRRLFLRYFSKIYDSNRIGLTLAEYLKAVYSSIEVKQLDTDEANNTPMFHNSQTPQSQEILIGPCGVGFRLTTNKLIVMLGPYHNRNLGLKG